MRGVYTVNNLNFSTFFVDLNQRLLLFRLFTMSQLQKHKPLTMVQNAELIFFKFLRLNISDLAVL